MHLRAHRIIAKGATTPRKPRPKLHDPLTGLPADISAQIIDLLRADDLHGVPLVHPSWAALFESGSSLEPALRGLVVKRFGLRVRPPHAASLSWGQLYLALRRERCHLCPAPDVAPFVYAGSSSLAIMLHYADVRQGAHAGPEPGLALFPVCTSCFRGLMNAPRESFVPVVESRAVEFVFPRSKGTVDVTCVETGYLYSDIPGFSQRQRENPIEYVLARPLAQAAGGHRFHVPAPIPTADEEGEPLVILQ